MLWLVGPPPPPTALAPRLSPKSGQLPNWRIEVIVRICEALSGKTREQLAADFSVGYFLTRSKRKAYWFALTA